MITVLNVDGRELTPCVSERAWREVNRAIWVDDRTIRLRYNPFLFPGYRKAALKRDRHTCQWCGAPATTVDHIVPSSKGGSDLPVNLLASCGECNTRRGNRSAVSYLRGKAKDLPKLPKVCYRVILALTLRLLRN